MAITARKMVLYEVIVGGESRLTWKLASDGALVNKGLEDNKNFSAKRCKGLQWGF